MHPIHPCQAWVIGVTGAPDDFPGRAKHCT